MLILKEHFSFFLLTSTLDIFVCRTSELDEVEFSKFHDSVKRGDIVGVIGFPGLCFRTFDSSQNLQEFHIIL